MGDARDVGGDVREALQLASEEAARALVDEWGFTKEEAFVFLSVACDVNICQACQLAVLGDRARRDPEDIRDAAPFASRSGRCVDVWLDVISVEC